FSDHGEAFKEHGWTLHGATLYEEEVRAALLMNWPEVLPKGRVVDDPVMLIDVAPTILGCCGLPAPPHYEGLDLSPTWREGRLPERPILSETLATYEGNALKMVALNEWKLVRSLFDGREELYRLPDEHTDLSRKEAPVRDALSALARRWVAEEDFWMLYAHGPGEFTATVRPQSREFLATIPFRDVLGSDSYVGDNDSSGGFFRLAWRPGDRTKGLFFQTFAADSSVHFDLRIDGRPAPEQIFIGTKRSHPTRVPFNLTQEGVAASD